MGTRTAHKTSLKLLTPLFFSWCSSLKSIHHFDRNKFRWSVVCAISLQLCFSGEGVAERRLSPAFHLLSIGEISLVGLLIRELCPGPGLVWIDVKRSGCDLCGFESSGVDRENKKCFTREEGLRHWKPPCPISWQSTYLLYSCCRDSRVEEKKRSSCLPFEQPLPTIMKPEWVLDTGGY